MTVDDHNSINLQNEILNASNLIIFPRLFFKSSLRLYFTDMALTILIIHIFQMTTISIPVSTIVQRCLFRNEKSKLTFTFTRTTNLDFLFEIECYLPRPVTTTEIRSLFNLASTRFLTDLLINPVTLLIIYSL